MPTTPASRLMRPIQGFMQNAAAGGIVLLVCAVLALVWANSPLADAYLYLFGSEKGESLTLSLGIAPATLGGSEALYISKPLILWINDGLMALFFFLIGLEIKREVLAGELKSPKKAALALSAAVGGMVAPAAFYVAVNWGEPTLGGWGVPMATDIAFALGVLALLGSRAPLALKIFLTALAIVDDLGAVMVIALFYTAELNLNALMLGFGFFAVMLVMNRLGVMRTAVYVVLGLALWVCFLKSGVHATIGGVLAALAIPATRRLDAPGFLKKAEYYLKEIREDAQPGTQLMTADQRDAVHALETISKAADAPLTRFEHALHGWIAFFVMPVFALANAGVAIPSDFGALLASPVMLGIVLGLVVGKQIGVFGFAYAAVKLGIASLPSGVTWKQVYGVSLLTGIGFTMSIFIANLAFVDAADLDAAKLAILIASTISGVAGYLLLRSSSGTPADTAAQDRDTLDEYYPDTKDGVPVAA
ncbi:MAG: Na+/H+ antiporter NhaA [Bacteroidota bacterium]